MAFLRGRDLRERNLRRQGLFTLTTISALLLCRIGQTQNKPVVPDRNIEALKLMARWVQAPPQVKYALIEEFLPGGRDTEAAEYFHERALAHPNDALMLAGDALFQARVAATLDLPMERLPAVNEAFEKLDRAVALAENATAGGNTVASKPTFASAVPRCFRGIVAAHLPRFLNRTEGAAADLNAALEAWKQNSDSLPHGLRRSAYRALSKVYSTLGKPNKARDALSKSGSPAIDPSQPLFTTEASFSRKTGFRFTSPHILEAAPGVFLAQGYDLTDIAFVRTTAGVVGIDSGAVPANFDAAVAELHKVQAGTLVARMQTGSLCDPVDTKANLQTQTKLERRTIGGVVFDIYPASLVTAGASGKSLIYLPASRTAFVGDAFLPSCDAGRSFGGKAVDGAAGSAERLFALLQLLSSLKPKLLLHAYAPLTEYVTADSLPGLEIALHEIQTKTEEQIAAQKSLFETLAIDSVPDRLQAYPSAALPFLLIRDTVVRHIYQQKSLSRTPKSSSLAIQDDLPPQRMAGALKLTAGGKETAYVRALQTLLKQDDIPSALRIADLGLKTHPQSKPISALRRQSLSNLLVKTQHLAPFAFLYYSRFVDFELPPIS